MASLLNNCPTCAQLELDQCTDIVIDAGLTPNTLYWWSLQDCHGNSWKHQDVTDADGKLTILKSYFPDGLFVPGFTFTITLRVNLTDVDLVDLTYNEVVYNCIEGVMVSNQEIIEATLLTIQCYVTAATNFELNNGTAGVLVQGGTAPYSYVWSNAGEHTSTLENLEPGEYTVNVTDAAGQEAQCTSIVEANPPDELFLTMASTPATVEGGSDGEASAVVTGGTPPYTYLWSNSATTATITGLIAGIYSVTITDDDGATITGDVEVSEPNADLLSLTSTGTQVNKNILGGSFENLWFNANNVFIDSADQNTNLARMGLKVALYPGGSQTAYCSYLIGDTVASGVGRVGNGYNPNPKWRYWDGTPCVPNAPAYDKGALNDGAVCYNWQYSFFADFVDRCVAMGMDVILGFNVGHDTLTNLFWAIDYIQGRGLTVVAVIYRQESNLLAYDNATVYPAGGTTYVSKFNTAYPTIKAAYPSIYVIVDAAPVEKPDSLSKNFNNAIAPTIMGEAPRAYGRDYTLKFTITDDLTTNLDTIDNAVDVLLVNRINAWKAKFLNQTKLLFTEFGAAHSVSALPYDKTWQACYYVVRAFVKLWEFNLTSVDYEIIGAVMYRLAVLKLDDVPTIDFYAYVQLGRLLKYTNPKYMTITVSNPMLKIFATKSTEDNKVVCMITNRGDVDVLIDTVTIDAVSHAITDCDLLYAENPTVQAFNFDQNRPPLSKRYSIMTFEISLA